MKSLLINSYELTLKIKEAFQLQRKLIGLSAFLLSGVAAQAVSIDEVDPGERFHVSLAQQTMTTGPEVESFATASQGTRLVVGLPSNSTEPGVVRVFDRVDETENFVQVGSDIINTLTYAKFGASVAINEAGDRLAIGAPEADNAETSGQNNGCVFIYKLIDGAWIAYGNPIWGVRNSQRFGKSISFSDDGLRLAIGSGETSYSFLSSVSVYQDSALAYQRIGGAIEAAVEGDRFGQSLQLSGDGQYLAVGAPQNTYAAGRPGSGYAQVFFLDANANFTEEFVWSQVGQELSLSTDDIAFGSTVTLNADGTRLAVGAPSAKVVNLYERTSSTWSLLETFSIVEATGFGSLCSLTDLGDVLAVTAVSPSRNRVFAFRETEDWRGKRWISTQANRPTWSSSPTSLELSVKSGSAGLISPDGRTLAYKESSSTTQTALGVIGSVRLSNSGLVWPDENPWQVFSEPLLGLNREDLFGQQVVLSADGQLMVVASPSALISGFGSATGKVNVYARSGSEDWQDLNFPTSLSGMQAGKGIGRCVAVSSSGNRVAVASEDKAWVYERIGTSWTQLGSAITFTSPPASLSLSADGSRLAVGLPDGGLEATGFVKIYALEEASWQALGDLLRGDENAGTIQQVGRKVCLNADGSRLATTHGDHIRVYQLSASGWGQLGNAIVVSSDEFQLSATGYKLVIGVNDDEATSVVSYAINSNGRWERFGEPLTAGYRTFSGVNSRENIASAISISAYGDRIAIASLGQAAASLPSHNEDIITDAGLVRVFEQNEDGSWSKFNSTIYGAESGTGFGSALAISADGLTIAIGAPNTTSALASRGSVITHTLETNAATTNPAGSLESLSSLRWLRYGDLDLADSSYQHIAPDQDGMTVGPFDSLAMSEDGSRIAFVDGASNVRVYLRQSPSSFFSDSRQLGETIDLEVPAGKVCLSSNGQFLGIVAVNFIEIREFDEASQTWVLTRERIEHGIDTDLTDSIDAPGEFDSNWIGGGYGFRDIHMNDDGTVVSTTCAALVKTPVDDNLRSTINMVYHFASGSSGGSSEWSAIFYQSQAQGTFPSEGTVRNSKIAMFPNGQRFVRLLLERTLDGTTLELQTWEFNSSTNKWFELASQNISPDLEIDSLSIAASGRHIAMYSSILESPSFGDVWIAEFYQGTWVQMGRLLGKAVGETSAANKRSSIKLSSDGLRAAVLTHDGGTSKTCSVYQYSGDNRQLLINNSFNGVWEPIGQSIYPAASATNGSYEYFQIPTSSIAMDGSGKFIAMATIKAHGLASGPEPADSLVGPFHVFELVNSPNNWTDSDADGIPDWRENGTGKLAGIYSGTDPDNRDSDGDGVPDGAELENGTDPNLADSDGDGTSDLIEINLGLTLPDIDRNQNGFSDFFEQRFSWFNPNQDSSWIDLDFIRELGVFRLDEVSELAISPRLERAGNGSQSMSFRFRSSDGNSVMVSNSSVSLPIDTEAKTGFFRVQLSDSSQDYSAPLVPQLAELDSDGDGLADRIEATIGTNPESQDSDGDGLDDYVEYRLSQFRPGDSNSNSNLDFLARVGLFTTNQLADRFSGRTMIVKSDAESSSPRLSVVIETSSNLGSWDPIEPAEIEIPADQLPTQKVYLISPR